MNLTAWILVLISQIALVAAQIFMKHAMARRELGPGKSGGWMTQLAVGIGTMTLWFMLWVGVMHRVELSKLMPLEGISPLLIVLGASLFLGERLGARGWAGVGLTCAGVLLVSAS